MLFVTSDQQIDKAARRAARDMISDLTDAGRHVPERWTAAHPPDVLVNRLEHDVLDRPMTEDEFAACCEAFRSEWALLMEHLADDCDRVCRANGHPNGY